MLWTFRAPIRSPVFERRSWAAAAVFCLPRPLLPLAPRRWGRRPPLRFGPVGPRGPPIGEGGPAVRGAGRSVDGGGGGGGKTPLCPCQAAGSPTPVSKGGSGETHAAVRGARAFSAADGRSADGVTEPPGGGGDKFRSD